MNENVRLLKTLADETRLRLFMLLATQELFVCQLMAVTGLSQSLISRSLALLERQGLLESRRQGKHVFYHLKKELPALGRVLMENLSGQREKSTPFGCDRANLELLCKRFQRGKDCDMATVRKFVAFRTKNNKRSQ